MTTMKNYLKKIKRKKAKAHQENQKIDDIDYAKCFGGGTCPYCGFDVMMMSLRNKDDKNYPVRIYLSLCVECGKSWILEVDQNDVIKIYKVVSTIFPNFDDFI